MYNNVVDASQFVGRGRDSSATVMVQNGISTILLILTILPFLITTILLIIEFFKEVKHKKAITIIQIIQLVFGLLLAMVYSNTKTTGVNYGDTLILESLVGFYIFFIIVIDIILLLIKLKSNSKIAKNVCIIICILSMISMIVLIPANREISLWGVGNNTDEESLERSRELIKNKYPKFFYVEGKHQDKFLFFNNFFTK